MVVEAAEEAAAGREACVHCFRTWGCRELTDVGNTRPCVNLRQPRQPCSNMISKLVVRCVHHREAIPAAPKRRRPPSATSMTVAGLQAALADRGLPQSGLKAALVARLNDARDSENKCTW